MGCSRERLLGKEANWEPLAIVHSSDRDRGDRGGRGVQGSPHGCPSTEAEEPPEVDPSLAPSSNPCHTVVD